MLNINCPLFSCNSSLTLYDITGKVIHAAQLANSNGEIEVNIDAENGIYFYQLISSDSKSVSGKIVVFK
jgi:hypothetical protein